MPPPVPVAVAFTTPCVLVVAPLATGIVTAALIELAVSERSPVVAVSGDPPVTPVAAPTTTLPPVLLICPLPPAVRLIEPDTAFVPSAGAELPVVTLSASTRSPLVVPSVIEPVGAPPLAVLMPTKVSTVPTVKPLLSATVMFAPNPVVVAATVLSLCATVPISTTSPARTTSP